MPVTTDTELFALRTLNKEQLIKKILELQDDMAELYDEDGIENSSTYQELYEEYDELKEKHQELKEKEHTLQAIIRCAVASRLSHFFPDELMEKQNCDLAEDCDMSELYASDFIEMIDAYAGFTPRTSK